MGGGGAAGAAGDASGLSAGEGVLEVESSSCVCGRGVLTLRGMTNVWGEEGRIVWCGFARVVNLIVEILTYLCLNVFFCRIRCRHVIEM